MKIILITQVFIFLFISELLAQDVERKRPKEWDGLVKGARFMDRYKPMSSIKDQHKASWGAAGVIYRDTSNGLEDDTWSYWGGNMLKGDDGTFHLFVCRWSEDHEKGHMAWPWSHVVHASCDNPLGPFVVVDSIGYGHNPEVHCLPNGKYFLYVNGGYYLAPSLQGPWEYHTFSYEQRGRPIFDHMTNCSFARREDGSFIMVGRGGEICFSKDGLPPYYQINQKTVYPPYEGRYEDPVIWRTNIQYHMIVNDWLGRIAYYLRSKDGIHWKLDAGEAYMPGIAVHDDGTVEDWYKFERVKVLQDDYGRAVQANFAVADTIKKQDRGDDNHSSKNISIPLTVGRLITILHPDTITAETSEIDLFVKAETGFDPQTDFDLKSLRFGASEQVNFGNGCRVKRTKRVGDDLLITFYGQGNGLTEDNFVAKLLGRNKNGELSFGYARLPWLNYRQQALSAGFPELGLNGRSLKIKVEVQNFGQVYSVISPIKIEYYEDGEWHYVSQGDIPCLGPFGKTFVELSGKKIAEQGEVVTVRVTIGQREQEPAVLEGRVIVR